MEDDSIESERELRRQRMKEFYQLSHILFTKPERLILYKILKDYKRRNDLERLIVGLSLVLRTYTKLELLKYVRYFLWEGHLPEFDRATKFHSRFRPRRRDDDNVKVGPSYLQVPDGQSLGSSQTRASGASSRRHFKDVRVFILHKTPGDDGLGFSVRGGSEHGLGIYVSEIDDGSAAAQSGLEVGDKILEANNISLKTVASSSAVKVLTGSKRLKLVVQRTRKVPEWRLSREKTSWYDVHDKKLISGEFEECGISHHIRGLDVDMPERRVNLKFGRGEKTLGFNIRGGREYGLGIYVSKLDKGGPSDTNGVRVGDQIIDVNGIPFENITHAHAVEVMKGKQHLILTLRDVGRYPVYKELYAEYTWSDGQLKAASSVTSLRDVQFEKEGLPNKALSVSDLFTRHRRPSSIQNEIFLPKKLPSQRLDESNEHLDDDNIQDTDSDSLINIEQWTGHLDDGESDNGGYVSDNENENGVVRVDVLHEGFERRIFHATKQMSNGEGIYDVSDSVEDSDNIYAQIKKVDESNAHLRKGKNHKKFEKLSVDVQDTQEQHVKDIYGHHTDSFDEENNHLSRSSIIENKLADSTHEPLNHKVEGGMYYQIRKSGSYSNLAQPLAGTSKSDDESVHSHASSERLNQTLQVRGFTKVMEDSDESDAENTKSAKTKGSSKTYNFQNDESHISNEVSYRLQTDDDKLLNVKRESEIKREVSGRESFRVEDLEERLKQLEKRQMSLGINELNSLSPKHEHGVEPKLKKGKWKNFKEKVKGSLRIKTSNSSKSGTLRKELMFDGRDNTIDEYNMASLEDEAKKMLSVDEFEAVIRHVKYYHESHELERLVETLLEILDKPEKLLLLRDIRGVIYPLDMVRFDNMVNIYEIEAYQKLSMKLHLPLNHKAQKKPRKTLMTTEIGNRRKRKSVHFAQTEGAEQSQDSTTENLDGEEAENGHFHIRPMYQYQREEEVVGLMKENVGEARHGSPSKQPMHQEVRQGSPFKQIMRQGPLSKQGSPFKQGPPFKQGSPFKQPMRQRSLDEANTVMGQFDYLDNEHGEDNLSVIVSSDPGSYGSSEVDRTPGAITVHLSKNKPDMGLELKDVTEHGVRDVRIHKILPHGAADDDSTIEVGMSLLAVDSHRVEGCTAAEALATLQKCYSDKHIVSMKLVLHKAQMTHF